MALVVLCSSLDEIESKAIVCALEEFGRTDLKKLVLTRDRAAVSAKGEIEVVQTPTTSQTFLSLVGAAVGTVK